MPTVDDRVRGAPSNGRASSWVRATPTFFVNGPQHTGAQGVTSLVAALRHTAGIARV
jgi:protein-disulfide isomerase